MRIFIGCSSRAPKNPDFTQIAEQIGTLLTQSRDDLVYGGCDRGLMGTVQETVAAHSTKSDIFIVTCNAYIEDIKSLSYLKASAFPTVNERKNKFIELSDVLVYLPGGIGTLDELFSAIESKKNGEHKLPIIIVNINNYFGPVLEMIDQVIENDFVLSTVKDLYTVVNSFEEFKTEFKKLH